MIARRNIRAGDEVTDFYGAHYFQSSRADRHALLGFPCACAACREDWPQMRGSLAPQLPRSARGSAWARDWAAARARLDTAVAGMRVVESWELSRQLAASHGE